MTDNLQLIKIDYEIDLNSKQKEIYNFQKAAAQLADFGYNCIKLSDDWQGADFLAYHKDGKNTLKVQLKARLTIAQKYDQHDDLYMCFPVKNRKDEVWYLISHKELVNKVRDTTNWLKSDSWTKKKHYSSQSPSKLLLSAIDHRKINYEKK